MKKIIILLIISILITGCNKKTAYTYNCLYNKETDKTSELFEVEVSADNNLILKASVKKDYTYFDINTYNYRLNNYPKDNITNEHFSSVFSFDKSLKEEKYVAEANYLKTTDEDIKSKKAYNLNLPKTNIEYQNGKYLLDSFLVNYRKKGYDCREK